MDQGTIYLQILFLGVPFTMLYNLVGAAMRSLGDSKEPLYALIISSVINLVLNLIFVSAGFGIVGIALATIFAQVLSRIYLWKRMRKKFPVLALMYAWPACWKALATRSSRLSIPPRQSSFG